MQLDEEMDHGPLVAQATLELPEWPVPGGELDELLFREGGKLLAEVVPLWMQGEITPEEQLHDDATYTDKLVKADGELDLQADSYQNYLKYCAYDGWPGTFFFVERDGKQVRVKVTDAELVAGEFRILKVIPEGKKEMDYSTFTGV
jgi:methionyl-tRNA formyltransferase